MAQLVTSQDWLHEAVRRAGSQSALARMLGLTQASVWGWLNASKDLPAEHVLKVEAATGISRHDLRPDLYPRADGRTPPDATLDRRPFADVSLRPAR